MTQLRIAIAADIHSDDRDGKWTHVRAEPPAARPRQQPLADLLDLVRAEGLTADYLIAPGDISNQASANGLSYGWRKVHALASALGAELLGVPGNHDVVTHEQSPDPRLALKALLPTFPTGDQSDDQHFWEHGWTIVERKDHRFLLIDSTFDFPPHPGDVAQDSPEWLEYTQAIDRGGFPIAVEDEIAAAVGGLSEKLNIAVVHHHPMEHQNHAWLQDEYGPMRRGSEMIDLLSRHETVGRWLIVHGHKHVPQLVTATATTMNGPVVLCGASVGARLWDPINTVTRNQFHLVTVQNDLPAPISGLAGTIDSFTWGFGVGWQVSERSGSGLPGTSGFGCTDHFRTLGGSVEAALRSSGGAFMRYEDLLTSVPQLPFVLPTDWEFLERYLETQGISFDRNRQNKIVQVSRTGAAA